MRKAAIAWICLCLASLLASLTIHWANHPGWLDFLINQEQVAMLAAAALGWFVRGRILGLAGGLWEGFGLGIIVDRLASLAMPSVPTSRDTALRLGAALASFAAAWLWQCLREPLLRGWAKIMRGRPASLAWQAVAVALCMLPCIVFGHDRLLDTLRGLGLVAWLASGFIRAKGLGLAPEWLRGSAALGLANYLFHLEAIPSSYHLPVLLAAYAGYLIVALSVHVQAEAMRQGNTPAVLRTLAGCLLAFALLDRLFTHPTPAKLLPLFVMAGAFVRVKVYGLKPAWVPGILAFFFSFVFFLIANSDGLVPNLPGILSILGFLLVGQLAYLYWGRIEKVDWSHRSLVLAGILAASLMADKWLISAEVACLALLWGGRWAVGWLKQRYFAGSWLALGRPPAAAPSAAKSSKSGGRKAGLAKGEAVCRHCGAKSKEGAAYCGSCGRHMGWQPDFEGMAAAVSARLQSWSKALRKDPKLRNGAAALAAAPVLAAALWLASPLLFTTVTSFTPQGEIAMANTQVRVRFSNDVAASGPLDQSFTFDPPLPGSVVLEDSRTLVFNPAASLKPATVYKVKLSGAGLSARRGVLWTGFSRRFATPAFVVSASRLFYTYDLVKGTEKTLMGELEFNYPVDLSELRKALHVSRDGEVLQADLQQSSLATRFFFRAGGFERGLKEEELGLLVDGGLGCLGGTRPLGSDFKRSITLPARPKMAVEKIELHHEPGTSLISILFSLPVSQAQVNQHVSIQPSLPFRVETEYTYAVLRADFQPNIDYKVTVDKGIQALSGEQSDDKSEETLRLEDAAPYVRFSENGRLLPLEGPLNLGIKSMNLDRFNVQVEKVYRNNLVAFLRGSGTWGLGTPVWNSNVDVKGGQINEEVETALNFRAWQAGKYKGMFFVRLSGASSGGGGGEDEEGESRAVGTETQYRWFLCTDLGLMAKRSGKDLWVQVLSLGHLGPLAGVRLQVVSDNNQVMQSETSDEQGRAVFKDWEQGEERMRAVALTAEKGDDFSFLAFNHNTLPQDRYDIGGDPMEAGSMEGFVSSDRGLYRPGDTAHFTAVVRNADLSPAAGLPLNLSATDAEGHALAAMKGLADAQGVASFDWALLGGIPTGAVNLGLDLENGVHLATTSIKVEEFIPDKIKVEVESREKTASAGVGLTFTVRARQLFGAPASGLKVRTWVEFKAKEFTAPDYPGYTFSDPARSLDGENVRLPQGQTDDQGAFQASFQAPISFLPPSMLQAVVYAEVYDTGGRPVAGNATFNIHRYDTYLGLKSEKGLHVAPRSRVTIRYAAVRPDGKPAAAKAIPLVVRRRVWFSIFRNARIKERPESSYYEETILGREVDIQGAGTFSFVPDKPGQYTVRIGGEDSMRSSLVVEVAGPDEAGQMENLNLENADKLTLSLDKPGYTPGNLAQLQVRAPFAGRLVLGIEREKVFSMQTLQVPAGLSVVSLPVQESYLPNVYVTGVLVRRPEERLRSLPMVSFGVLPLKVDASSRQLKLQWSAPETTHSQDGIEASLEVPGGAGARVVVAAVDEGILQVANFVTPDPFAHFYRKRSLNTQTWCLFEDALPDLPRREAVGGDEDEGFVRRHLNPVEAKRVKPLAFYSGVLTADAQGRVRVHVPTRAFHGDVRLMAMAVRGSSFGAAAFHTKVADEIVIESSMPRFLAPGDEVDVPVTLFNRSGRRQVLKASLRAEGAVRPQGAPQSLTLEEGRQAKVAFKAKADMDAGKAVLTVRVETAAGQSFDDTTELAVRPGFPLKTSVDFGELAPGASREMAVPGGFIRQGQTVRLVAGNNVLVTYLRSLDYLLQYPHGCNEQITSQAFPLLYFKDMGLLTGRFGSQGRTVEKNVQDVVDRLSRNQLSEGGFAFWEGETEANEWLSNYAAHFLLEATKQGYSVPDAVLEKIKRRLGMMEVRGAKGRLDRRQENVEMQDSAYILYLRVLAGLPDRESMAAMRQTKLEQRGTQDRCLLSLAFSALGDKGAALEVLPKDVVGHLPGSRSLTEDLDTPTRELSLYLLALTQADPESSQIPGLMREFGKHLREGHFGSTQEDAWAFMALGNAARNLRQLSPLRADWSLKEAPDQVHSLTGKTAEVSQTSLSGKHLLLRNTGGDPLYYTLLAEGTPLKADKEDSAEGIRVHRRYRDESGKDVNLGSVSQGELVVVTLDVDCRQKVDHLVIADLLPAGFEVDNPRLRSRGALGFDPENTLEPASMDFRDDRVLLYTGELEGEHSFSYSVRAVTPGRFMVPGLVAESMYNPEVYGREYTGESLVVVENKFDEFSGK